MSDNNVSCVFLLSKKLNMMAVENTKPPQQSPSNIELRLSFQKLTGPKVNNVFKAVPHSLSLRWLMGVGF